MPINYKNYHPDWLTVIRPAILKREQYKCKQCKVKHNAWGYRNTNGLFVECDAFQNAWAKRNGYKVFRIILTIAHLDHNINNNDYSNLAALCQKCHNNYDKVYRIQNRKANMKAIHELTFKEVTQMNSNTRFRELFEYNKMLEREKQQIVKSMPPPMTFTEREKWYKKCVRSITKYNVKITIVQCKMKGML